MKKILTIIGYLSLFSLICVFVGHAFWAFHFKTIKMDEFKKKIDYILKVTVEEFFNKETPRLVLGVNLCYSLSPDKQNFVFSYNDKERKNIPISSPHMFHDLSLKVAYDCWVYNIRMNIEDISAFYKKLLREKGITETPHLMIRDSVSNKILCCNAAECQSKVIETIPIDLGYDYKHQLIASFEEPSLFQTFKNLLWLELVFFVSFLLCMICQWHFINKTWQSARVQTMSIAHFEHEMKKPLATMISAISGIISRQESLLSERDTLRLSMVRARLRKMSDITDTMLTGIKTSRLLIERKPMDIHEEMDLLVEMYMMLKPRAKVETIVDEGISKPLLDDTYFEFLLVNLVDNGIKYGGEAPVVKVHFAEENNKYILTVEDNGIGIAISEQKHIFKQFYRIRDERVQRTTGFGLGLAFVRKVVKAYGGEIKLQSTLGKGSKFTIILPGNDENSKSIVCRGRSTDSNGSDG